MKLEEGMYVRTKWGINKINEYVPQSGQLYLKNDVCVISNVIKASHNIIDLIEVGDYVNGYKVCEIIEKGQKSYNGEIAKEKCFCLGNNYNFKCYNNEIENIVTKEQFESMSYKVEG